jgi:hypothetical protein
MRISFILIIYCILIAFSGVASAYSNTRIRMSDKDIKSILIQTNNAKMTSAWGLYGYKLKQLSSSCETSGNIYVFNKPTMISNTLMRSELQRLHFYYNRNENAKCDLKYEKIISMRIGKIIDKSTISLSDLVPDHEYFVIQGKISNHELIKLADLIERIRVCALKHDKCDNFKLSISLPSDAINKINNIRANNISSIKILPTPKSEGAYLIQFKNFTVSELILFIYDINQFKSYVDITFMFPERKK